MLPREEEGLRVNMEKGRGLKKGFAWVLVGSEE